MTGGSGLSRRQAVALLGVATAGPLFHARTLAQAVPGTARVILGPAPGSSIDHLARVTAEALKPHYAPTMLVENRTGGSGVIAVQAVKAAPPDGSMILFGPSAPITVYPISHRKLPYNPDVDLQPVSVIANFDLALAVGPLVPASVTDLKTFFAWCKANPDKASFGSPGNGSILHFTGSMTARTAGAEMLHSAYRGTTPAITDMIAGQIAGVMAPVGDFREFAAAGRCRILGVTSPQRSRFAPNVPTFQEQGLGEYASRDWIGAFVPAATPAPLVQKIGAALKLALADKAVVAAAEQHAMEAAWCTPQELAARMRADRERWAKVVKALNFTADS